MQSSLVTEEASMKNAKQEREEGVHSLHPTSKSNLVDQPPSTHSVIFLHPLHSHLYQVVYTHRHYFTTFHSFYTLFFSLTLSSPKRLTDTRWPQWNQHGRRAATCMWGSGDSGGRGPEIQQTANIPGVSLPHPKVTQRITSWGPWQRMWASLVGDERDGNTRPPHLPLEKSVCRSGSNS